MPVDAYIGGLAEYVHDWANSTFPDRQPKAALTKLVMSEIPELLVELQTNGPGPHLEGEWADCLILLLDLAAIWGIEPAEAIMAKMRVNEARTWVKDEELGHYQHESTCECDPARRYACTVIDGKNRCGSCGKVYI